MSENTQNQNPQQEQYSLNDDRRVKVGRLLTSCCLTKLTCSVWAPLS